MLLTLSASDGCRCGRVWRQCSDSPWQETIIRRASDGLLSEAVRPISDAQVLSCLAAMQAVGNPAKPLWTQWLDRVVGAKGMQSVCRSLKHRSATCQLS